MPGSDEAAVVHQLTFLYMLADGLWSANDVEMDSTANDVEMPQTCTQSTDVAAQSVRLKQLNLLSQRYRCAYIHSHVNRGRCFTFRNRNSIARLCQMSFSHRRRSCDRHC